MALYGNYRPNESGSIELDSQQYEIASLQSKGEDEELYCVIDCDIVESNISNAGTSPVQQANSKTDSNKLGENVFASSSHPTEEQDNIIGRKNNNTLKDSSHQKSNTKATIMFIICIVAVGIASSAITVFVKDIKSSEQDDKQINSYTKTEILTEISSLNPCNGSVLTLIANDTTATLMSPGYPFSHSKNLSCSWLIDSGFDGQPIAISLDFYNMNCLFGDSLSVYDGSSTSDLTLVNSVCGRNNVTQVYVSSDRNVLVTFITDSANQGQGFQLTYVNIPDKLLKHCDESAFPLSSSKTTGTLVSPGYPFSYANNLSCSWLIDSGIDGQSIAISLDFYNMNCSFGDSLSVYDGSSTSDLTLVDFLCGKNNVRQVYLSSDRNVLVTFTTDSDKQGQGFQLTYVNIPDKSLNACHSSTLSLRASHTQNVLVSPGYPFSYANELSCSWLIDSGVDGQSMSISLDYYNMDCSFGDTFSVFDGSSNSDITLVNSTCGKNKATQLYVSSDRYVLVTFTTDSDNQGQGFQLSYINVPDKSLNPCNRSTVTLRASYTTNTLISTGYPFTYAQNLLCSWLIDSSNDGKSIAISLDYYNMNCSFGDSFTVYDGSSTTDLTLVNSVCGRSNVRQVYVSSDRYVLVTFTTDDANQGQGFQLSYTKVPDKSLNRCDKPTMPLRASHTQEILVSPGYPFSYANNVSCSWLIDSGTVGQSIAISLDYYNIACSFGDSFSVYDGSSTSDFTLVNSACGINNVRQVYISSDRNVLVTFTTDSANQGQGFQLSYANIPDTSLNLCDKSALTLSTSNFRAVLESPGYPFSYANNLACSWLIDSGIDGQFIAISLDYYNMDCSFGDSLSVYDGSSTSDLKLVNSACGRNSAKQMYVSSDRHVLVTFTTDGANQGQGFQLTYVNIPDESLKPCNGYELKLSASNKREVLISPGYPFSYSKNLSCSWLIDSGIDGQPIAIYLEHYNMNCSLGDSFSVYNGSSNVDVALVNAACGRNKATQLYVSSDRYVLVTLTAYYVSQGHGFQLAYVKGSEESSYTCPVTQTSVSASITPGQLTSPGYPYITLLANYLSCTWLIDSGVDGQPILLYYIEVCKMEFPYGQKIIIYDGSTSSNSLFYKSCQPGLDGRYGPYVSSDRYALVSFVTLSANQGEGFQLRYVSASDTSATGCNSTYTLTASTNVQYLTSEGFPSKYSDNSNCSWLISAYDSTATISIAIVWSEIETYSRCGYDYLEFYNGDSTNDPLLMTKYCVKVTDPDVTPTTYTSSSTNVLVVFVSDGDTTYRGFIIKYSVTMENTRP